MHKLAQFPAQLSIITDFRENPKIIFTCESTEYGGGDVVRDGYPLPPWQLW
jgi:hypothetical protein